MRTSYLLLIFLGFYFPSKAQEKNHVIESRDSTRRVHVQFISDSLFVDNDKAEQVLIIVDKYKAALNKINEEKKLSNDQLSNMINILIEEKNRGLKLILDEKQLQKFLPTSEW